ncbi:MAG: hypothetical protein H6745_29740 [Deltaproteobacteria bacterium]|nr:hypothetical protein [Deltaproteobacteria bacterium]
MRHLARHLPLALTLAALALAPAPSCAALGGDDGGGANLPNRGIGPWDALDLDGALLLSPPVGGALGEPSALADDGGIRLFVDETSDGGDVAVVAFAAGADGTALTRVGPVLAGARDPSVARDAGGGLWMAYVDDATGAIGVAEAGADGAFTARAAAAVEPGADEVVASPSLARDGARWLLYYTLVRGGDAPVIARASAGDDLAFAFDAVVLSPGEGCVDAAGAEETCWDAGSVSAPEVRVAVNEAGQRLYRMFYRGAKASQGDLGFAASYDGLTFSRYPYNPVVDATVDLDGPANVRVGDRFLLYWHETRSSSVSGLGGGQNDAGKPSERF